MLGEELILPSSQECAGNSQASINREQWIPFWRVKVSEVFVKKSEVEWVWSICGVKVSEVECEVGSVK